MPLTLAQLATYEAFGGDIDGWTRSALRESDPATGEHWGLIDELLMGLTIEASGLATETFRQDLHARIRDAAPDPALHDRLLALSRRSRPSDR